MLMMVFLLLWLSGIPLLLMDELVEHYLNNKEQGKEQWQKILPYAHTKEKNNEYYRDYYILPMRLCNVLNVT